MPRVYRAMLRDGDRPKVGPTKKMLGVKPGKGEHDDIATDSNGDVVPNAGGMSVAPNWRDLPPHRIPRRLRNKCPKAAGNEDYVCWKFGDGSFEKGTFAEDLVLVVDRLDHGTVQPAFKMKLDEFQMALAATQGGWTIDEE